MAEEKKTYWQPPLFTASASDRIGWIEDQLQESEGWLEGQKAYKNIARNLRIFGGVLNDKVKSSLISGTMKYNIRKFVETISEVREIGTYDSDAPQFKPIAGLINKVSKAVYRESEFSRQLRKALQFSAVMGRGYLWPRCKADDFGYGERRIDFGALGPLDVMPFQIPADGNVQNSYAVTVFDYVPIAEAHGKFPAFQSILQPIDTTRHVSRLQDKRQAYAWKFVSGEGQRNWGSLYCEIRYTYIHDLTINPFNKEIPMGDPKTGWFYKVPCVGQEIFGGVKDGQPFMRRATIEDCRVYPYLRLIISAHGMDTPMYDGPAFDWHGKIPVIAYDVDDWAWEGMGFSLVDDVGSIESTKRKIERKVDQVIDTTLNPPMGYDRTSTGGPKIENFDIFDQNTRYGVDGEPKHILQSLLPDEVRVDEKHFKFIEYLNQIEEKQMGLNDLGSLSNLKFNISDNSFEKALESIGPIARGIAAGMEAANAKVAYLLKFMIPQWFDTRRVIEYVGPDNVTSEVFDFDPASLVPSHMPDEYINDDKPHGASAYERVQRARNLAKNIRLVSVPDTLLRTTQMQEQLKFLQLKRGNAPISWCTVMKKLGVENFGDIEGNTEFERWQNEEMAMLAVKAKAAFMAQQLGMGGGAPAPGGDGKHAGGRKPSGQKPPRLVQKGAKGGEVRTTVKES